MDSRSIEQMLGNPTGGWARLEEAAVARISPSSTGVYVIRAADGQTFGRLRGTSDLIYIGSGSISDRLKCHLNWRSDFRDKGWLFSLIANCNGLVTMEFGHFPCENYKQLESDLLFGFLKSHLELPPANLQIRLSDPQKGQLLLMVVNPSLREIVLKDLEVQIKKRVPTDPGVSS